MPTEARETTPEQGPESGLAVGHRYTIKGPVRPGCNVWRAVDAVGCDVALKAGPRNVIEPEYGLLVALNHPHIVRATDLFRVEAGAVMALEYLSGGDLVSLTGEPPRYWLGAVAEIIQALGYLHARGLVHRDLKARNVMFDAAGRVRLTDFGSAAAIGERWSAGGTTTAAVDPDRGNVPVSSDDDIYALAALVHELAHGTPPGGGRGAPGSMPPALERIVSGCLAGRGFSTPGALSRFGAVIESLLGHDDRSLRA